MSGALGDDAGPRRGPDSQRGDTFALRRLRATTDAELEALSALLMDCVDGGASVGFLSPLARERALAFWQSVARDVNAGGRALLVAEDADGLCGTVQLVLALPDNQPHRADLVKLLVAPRARRRGVGAALMRAAEQVAHEHERSVLVLDTVTGSAASRLYEQLGWQRVGDIPRYALMPDGSPCSTTYYCKDLGAG